MAVEAIACNIIVKYTLIVIYTGGDYGNYSFEATIPSVIGAEPAELFRKNKEMAEEDFGNGFHDWHVYDFKSGWGPELRDVYENQPYLAYINGEIDVDGFIVKWDELLKARIEEMKKTADWDMSMW